MRFQSALVSAVSILALASGLAQAQDVSTSANPNPDETTITSGDKLPSEHAFGDWGGARPWLTDRGVDLGLTYESETAAVVDGGERRGVDYAHSINLKTDLDMAKLAGLKDFSVHTVLIERAGRNASSDFLGEHLTEVQEIYGSGGNVAAKLVYLYGEQKLLGGAVDIEAGRLDVGQDFANSPLYCQFMTLSVCPSPRLLSLQTGFTIFPLSTWGGRVRLAPSKLTYLQVGAYQVRPEDGGRAGFDFSTTDTTGAFLPVEFGWEPQFGPDKLVGHYMLGGTYDTSNYPDLWEGSGAVPVGAGGGTARTHRGRASFYLLADQMVRRTGPNGTDGVILLGGYTRADPHTAVMSDLAFLGVLASGVVPSRPKDTVGTQVVHFKVSDQLAATQNLEAAQGLPLSSGLGAAAAPAAGVQGEQTMVEGRYDIHVATGVHVMPDVQYVIHPDGATRYPDATVLSLRLDVDF